MSAIAMRWTFWRTGHCDNRPSSPMNGRKSRGSSDRIILCPPAEASHATRRSLPRCVELRHQAEMIRGPDAVRAGDAKEDLARGRHEPPRGAALDEDVIDR